MARRVFRYRGEYEASAVCLAIPCPWPPTNAVGYDGLQEVRTAARDHAWVTGHTVVVRLASADYYDGSVNRETEDKGENED